jgi:hypothetical protein
MKTTNLYLKEARLWFVMAQTNGKEREFCEMKSWLSLFLWALYEQEAE